MSNRQQAQSAPTVALLPWVAGTSATDIVTITNVSFGSDTFDAANSVLSNSITK